MKLYYFGIPGRGEAIRLACAYGKVSFEDILLNEEEFEDMKKCGKLPFQQLPVLEVSEGVYIGQSAAIIRYIGRLCGLYPVNDAIQSAIIDSLIDQLADMTTGFTISRYSSRFGFGSLTAENIQTIRKELNDDILPRHFAYFENFLQKSSTGWLANTEEPSIADFMLVPRLMNIVTPGLHAGLSPTLLDPFPGLKELIRRLMDLPAIQEYYAASVAKL
jgi:prostaglandin-H2 D-isomerase / glutathione transferase